MGLYHCEKKVRGLNVIPWYANLGSTCRQEYWSTGLPWRDAAQYQPDLSFLAEFYLEYPICRARSGPGSVGVLQNT
jgi:hypothetical protein